MRTRPLDRALRVLCLMCTVGVCGARAQQLPTRPIALANGVVTLSSDVSASIGPTDNGFFNYTDYDRSALRLLRIDVAAAIRAGDHLSILGELRSENVDSPEVYALYLRIHPWTGHGFDVQIGRVPPTFGAFARRTYASDNPLIGYPLAYQYLTSLRPDAVPADANELLRMRGRGWASTFSVGNPTAAHGVPLVSAFTWDTGVQVHAGSTGAEITAALTEGTVANPLFRDDNDGRQFAARAAIRPAAGLVLGGSVSRGLFVSRTAAARAIDAGASGVATDFTQTAWGADVEYSRGYYVVRAEGVVSRWTMPVVRAPALTNPLQAVGAFVEAIYKVRPDLYLAARADHLGFSNITGTAGPEPWDAPVTRIEFGGGYRLSRNVLLKVSYQVNSRSATARSVGRFPAASLVYWF